MPLHKEPRSYTVHVEIVYAQADEQVLLALNVNEDATIAQAITQSGLLDQFSELAMDSLQVGIFSRKATLDTLLQSGDRIEIYRPLTIDPKEARRLRGK